MNVFRGLENTPEALGAQPSLPFPGDIRADEATGAEAGVWWGLGEPGTSLLSALPASRVSASCWAQSILCVAIWSCKGPQSLALFVFPFKAERLPVASHVTLDLCPKPLKASVSTFIKCTL